MRAICKLLCIILLITFLCSCGEVDSDERTLKEALPEPFSLWVGAEERVNKDSISWQPVIFDINTESELKALMEEYKFRIPKCDYDFNKTFFNKNKLYLILRDGVSNSTYGKLESFTVDDNGLHISFQAFQNTMDADSGTHGYIVAVSRETVKSIKSVENIKVEYLY